MKAGAERRRHSRGKKCEPQNLRIGLDDQAGSPVELPAQLVDIGEGGLGVEISMPLAAGSLVYVLGELASGGPRKDVRTRARVSWCLAGLNGAYTVGLAFDDPAGREFFNHARDNCFPAQQSSLDYYEVLEVSNKAAPDTIHRVYRLLAQRYHPDNSETGNEEIFKVLLQAYRVLSDPEQRAAYDVQQRSNRQLRWKIFDSAQEARGLEAEKRKRHGILSLLYTKRINQPEQPTMTLHDLEDLLGCPREHLEFSLWYLKENAWIARGDNTRYSITVKGVDQAEAAGTWRPTEGRLLSAAQ